MMNYNFFGWEFNLNPVAFSINGWGVYWYGIIITLGFVLAVIYGIKRAPKFGVNPDRLIDCILVTAPLSILGARLYYVVFGDISFSQFFNIHQGGLAIYGATITAIVVGALMCKLRKVSILSALDLTALGFLLAQGIGRWGNFVNQEAYGSVTGSSWFGISGDKIIQEMDTDQMVHPCFLYESIWCILGFVVLHLISKKRKFVGEIGALYLIWYGLGRFFIEYLRTDSLFGGNIKVSMLLSALLVVVGAVLLVI
ncbi:MAG: prolipoprotein diacylglyceryl transferase, partial [Clostridia bacterium]|nr:prolipoprotein diacylglyceryl transferase [Clostridia bacterium]